MAVTVRAWSKDALRQSFHPLTPAVCSFLRKYKLISMEDSPPLPPIERSHTDFILKNQDLLSTTHLSLSQTLQATRKGLLCMDSSNLAIAQGIPDF